MQYLMVYSSNPEYPRDGEWKDNGAGLRVSHWYGFGIIDGATLVNRARNWITVPEQRNCSFNVTDGFEGKKIATSNSQLIMDIQVSNCNLVYLEHVQAVTSLHITAGMRKDISITLTSAVGTVSTLLPYRQHDRHRDGFHSWPFMTVHSWGEQPEGKWAFGIQVMHDSEVILESLQLVLYGTQSVPPSVLAIPNQCHPECVRACAREGPEYCDMCKHYRLADSLQCVKNCPLGTYVNGNTCRSCPLLCAECEDAHTCVQCYPRAFRLIDGSCSDHCSGGTFPTANKSCLVCHQSCKTCDGPHDTDCTSCHPQFTLQGDACVIREPTSCPIGYYFDHRAHECRSCHKSCASCSGKESTLCASCFRGAVISEEGRCIDTRQLRSCFAGQYFDGDKFECATCPSYCSSCSNNLTCNSCLPGIYLTRHGNCVESCHPREICTDMHCHKSCLTCFGPEPVHCNSCPEDLLLANNSCVQHCPLKFFTSKQSCKICHENCKSCMGPSENDCLTCPPKKLLNDHSCVTSCPAGTYSEEIVCSKCLKDCISCVAQDSCSRCKSGYYLLDVHPIARCVGQCPLGFVAQHSSATCQPCPSNCAICHTSSTCDACQPGYAYYAPSGLCLDTCPLGYYSSPAGSCITCQLPCSTCIGSALNCSSCSRGMALDTASQVCRECCNADKAVVQCCDCDADRKFCHWLNFTKLPDGPAPSTDGAYVSTHIVVGVCIAILVVLLCVFLFIILVRYYFSRFSRKYQMVPNQEGLEIASDDGSGSDTDFYVTSSEIVS